jgi:hypothetical protein
MRVSYYNTPYVVGKARATRPVPPGITEEIRAMIPAIGRINSLLATSGMNWSDIAAAVAPQSRHRSTRPAIG